VSINDKTRVFSEGEPGEITKKLYDLLTGIQRKEVEDEFNWVLEV
jgi:branched-chain amino acid aminotransferase